ncbi:MAG: hypothetical protein KC668_21140 [Myxococcales bacterium]|nr:hypothetical protein [Myxococcales bacterium]
MPLERGNVFSSPTSVDPVFTINASAQYAIVGPVARGRVPVRMVNPIRSGTLYMDETECHVVARVRGSLAGVPISFDAGNSFIVAGPGATEGTTRVRARVQIMELRGMSDRLQELGVYEGDIPTTQLGAEWPAVRDRLPRLSRAIVTGQLSLSAEPGGVPFRTFNLMDETPLAVVRRDGTHTAVRVGNGPYVYGWTDAVLARDPERWAIGALGPRTSGPPPVVPHIREGTQIELQPGVTVVATEALPVLPGARQPNGRVAIELRRGRGVLLTGVVDASDVSVGPLP